MPGPVPTNDQFMKSPGAHTLLHGSSAGESLSDYSLDDSGGTAVHAVSMI